MVTISIAGLNVGIDNQYNLTPLLRDFITDAPPDFTVSVTQEELDAEDVEKQYSRAYLEFVCAYRRIAQRILDYDAFVMHGVAIARNNRAYLITAPSGTGKTTHARLWLQCLPRTGILNGDKPILRKIDGVYYACGTPWRGKENYGIPYMLPLKSIGFLSRSPVNAASMLTPEKACTLALRQVYMPKQQEQLSKLLSLLSDCLMTVPCFSLACNMESDAARLSYETMSQSE